MDLFHKLFGTDLVASLFVIANLFLVESLLSIDNAAVLATMVRKLKGDERDKALHLGVWGALIMRGGCMLIASWLVGFWMLKVAGGLYLLYLCWAHFKPGQQGLEDTPEDSDPDKSAIVLWAEKYLKLNQFWATVILVELMDMAFSVDNIFAAVAFTKFAGLICVGVFIGIFAMRFVAGKFVKLMDAFPFLENVAYIVIGILGVKLTITFIEYLPWTKDSGLVKFMKTESFDLIFSLLTLVVFITPVLWVWAKKKFLGGDGPDEGEFVTPIKLSDGSIVTTATIGKTTTITQPLTDAA